MTDQEIQEAMTQAASKGAAKAIELHAAALRSISPSKHKQLSPTAIASIAIALLIPISGWVNSVSSRVSVLESNNAAVQAKLDTLDSLIKDMAALKQAVEDFRADSRDYRKDRDGIKL